MALAPRRTPWLTVMLVAVLAGALAAPGVARADGDPASDVLLGENVFYPYAPPVAASVQKTLNSETAAAKRAGFPIKVALIGSPVDLGVIPDLFGKPQKYADFLDQEISFQAKQPLLVVMSTGFGTQGVTGAVTSAVAGLGRPAGSSSTELANAAITAVAKLAGAAGHPIQGVSGVPGSQSAGSGRSSATLIAGLAVGAVLTAGALAAVALRRRRTQAPG